VLLMPFGIAISGDGLVMVATDWWWPVRPRDSNLWFCGRHMMPLNDIPVLHDSVWKVVVDSVVLSYHRCLTNAWG
jgi:hypothetical protein